MKTTGYFFATLRSLLPGRRASVSAGSGRSARLRQTRLKVWHAFCLLLLISLNGFAQGKEPVPFEPGDTLEVLRAKIEYNGYDFKVDHNWVFDMPVEQQASLFGLHPPLVPAPTLGSSEDYGPLFQLGPKDLPTRFCWTNYNGHSYIGPIRSQGYCGSCYAFGACAAAEGTYNAAMGLYDSDCIDFSESYIIWCLGRLSQYSSHFSGCNGGDFDYYQLQALTVQGITDEAHFPYTPVDPGSCTHWSDPTWRFASWHRIPCRDIVAMKTALMTYGVLYVGVQTDSAFVAYSSGIYENADTNCNASPCYYKFTNHAVGLVGWDDNNGNGYWILRNSWGTSWGEGGYMRIKYTSASVTCDTAYLVYTPDPLQVTPAKRLNACGPSGGPFAPACQT